MKKNHEYYVSKIILKEFNESPIRITRMTIGIVNEVYLVVLKNKEIIVRLNKNKDLILGSSKYIPLYSSKGIKVPEILVENYSKKVIHYCYQILSKIEGKDIDKVISKLSNKELKEIAKEIANIIMKLRKIPTNREFGYVRTKEKNLFNSWSDYMNNMIKEIEKNNKKTKVLDKNTLDILNELLIKYKDYFDKVKSEFYYDDLSSKNVMINKGKFNGIVDLDGAMYGDPIEAIGRIKASWCGKYYGEFYTSAVIKELKLDNTQKKMVTVYAIFNLVGWMCETGDFNANVSKEIDWNEVKKDKEKLNKLYNELSKK
ncbi:phosphotransferase [Candidatus Woesearchaeota archaeon]|nr:phosphotransferase [Candidatus Woesearchaeota archaeon]